jgi:hypothetical protein
MLRLAAPRSWHCCRKRCPTDTRRPCRGLCPQSPRDPWVRLCKQGTSDVLFAFAELCTYPTRCCLHFGHIGLIAPLLLAVLSHRLADALRSTDRVTTPRSWPSLGACALGRSLSTSLHRDPSSARWLQATSWTNTLKASQSLHMVLNAPPSLLADSKLLTTGPSRSSPRRSRILRDSVARNSSRS